MCLLAKANSEGMKEHKVDIAYTFTENLNRNNAIAEGMDDFRYVKHVESDKKIYNALKKTE